MLNVDCIYDAYESNGILTQINFNTISFVFVLALPVAGCILASFLFELEVT